MVNVIGLCGSLRKGSWNRKLLVACQGLAPAGMAIDIFDLADIPMYNADIHEAGLPAPVAAFLDAARAADGVLIASPEYNRSVPAVLKNAIDWASKSPPQPFDDKPVAIMGASRGVLGTIMANHHLRQILVYLNARTINGPEVLVGQAPSKFDGDGTLTDEPTRDFIARHLEKLAREIARQGQSGNAVQVPSTSGTRAAASV